MAEVDTVVIPTIDEPTTGEEVATLSKAIKTIGLPIDDKSTATDTTSTTHTSILKQISASIQAAAASLALLDNSIASGNELQADIVGALPAGDNNIGNVDVATIAGGVAANAADTATPVKVGGRYDATLPTYDDGDVTNVQVGSRGSALVTLMASNSATPVALGSGSVTTATMRTTLATDVALPAGTNNIGKVDHGSTGIGHGVKTVTSAGTDEALAGSTAAKRVTIQAQTDNTGYIAVGATGVDATVATGNGVLLAAGDTYTINIDNLADVFIDATVNGDGVRYTYET